MSTATSSDSFWARAFSYLFLDKDGSIWSSLGTLLLSYAFISHILTVYRWEYTNRFQKTHGDEGALPARYPSLVPYFGHALSLAWDSAAFLRRATSYDGRLTASRISLLGFEIYFFQDRSTVAKLWGQTTTLSRSDSVYMHAKRYLFGTTENYYSLQDRASAPNRDDTQSLEGNELASATKRYVEVLKTKLEQKPFSGDWTHVNDLADFFEDVVGLSLSDSLHGSTMSQLHSEVVGRILGDENGAGLSSRSIMSRIKPLAPWPHRIILNLLRRWHACAKRDNESSSTELGITEYPQEKSLSTNRQYHDEPERNGLGTLQRATSNTAPCAMLAALHIFQDPVLLERVRDEIDGLLAGKPLAEADPTQLAELPLLSSVYAETLRLHVKTSFAIASLNDGNDFHLGRWLLPRGHVGFVNAGISHLDESFWNSHGGEYPASTFWADRFLVNPSDEQSGPVAPHARDSEVLAMYGDEETTKSSSSGFVFSLQGTEGSWFPYGGGSGICPGRSLDKNIIAFTCAQLVKRYDIELLTDKVDMSTGRFGVGVEGPKKALPFRVRKRSPESQV